MRSGSYGPRFPEGYGTEQHPLETFALWILGALILAGALVWAAGELSGRLFGGSWPRVSLSETGSVLTALPRHAGDPAATWPTPARRLVPGPLFFYGTFAAMLMPLVVTIPVIVSRLRDRHLVQGTARWARPG